MHALHALTHVLGSLLGVALYPVTLGFLIRNRFARAFHPDGTVVAATFVARGAEGAFLAGPAIARLSATMVRGEAEKPDVLGLVVRFGARAEAPQPRDAQDVLSASFDSFAPARLKAALKKTNCHDYLDNEYRAVALYDVPGIGLGHMRFVGVRRASNGAQTRGERLDEAMAAREARFELQVSTSGASSDSSAEWRTLGLLDLEKRLDLSQKQLAFTPFRSGRGIRPTGFVNGLRRANYLLSRFMRGAPMR